MKNKSEFPNVVLELFDWKLDDNRLDGRDSKRPNRCLGPIKYQRETELKVLNRY